MKDSTRRFANLSPEQRQLVLKKLREQALISVSDQEPAPPIMPVPRTGDLPLSFAQQRLWFLNQLEPSSPVYNFPLIGVRLTGRLDVAALRQSLKRIVQRHKVLRTTFSTMEGRPIQVIAPAMPVALPIVDLEAVDPEERETCLRRLAIAEAQRPFDLQHGPLMRNLLLRLSPQEHILLPLIHHIVFDLWSLGIFIRELATLYRAFSTDGGRVQSTNAFPPLAELPIQYADYAVWQRQWLSPMKENGQGESVLEKQLCYWKRQLADAPAVLELPTDRPRPPVQTFRGAKHTFTLPRSLAEALKTLSQGEGVTLFMTLLAAFQTLLYRYTGQPDIVVGSPIANRNRAQVEGLIGFFVNTLALRTDLRGAGDPTFRELLKRVREVTLGAYAHQDLPFEKLVEELQPERSLSYSPILQVLFTLQNVQSVQGMLQEPLVLPGLTLNPIEFDTGIARFDLSLSILEIPAGLLGVLEYNTDLFDAKTITRMEGHFRTLLDGIVADPEQRLWMLPLLTKAEHHQMLVEWNDTQTPYPQDTIIHELFEAQVERTPDVVAVVFLPESGQEADEQLTYGELNRRANQLAHHLQSLGVGPEALVGLCVERSLEMVVGLLGILKAGGAYVPLDPTYPQERLAFMMQDAGALVLVTQERWVEQMLADKAQIVRLDADRETIFQQSAESPNNQASADSPAYAIYTSGSAGAPKGVLGLHGGAINRFQWMWSTYPFASHEVCCQKTALSFVDSVWEIFGPLLCGIRTVILADAIVKDPLRLVQSLAVHQVTRIVLVPSLLQAMLDASPGLQRQLPHLALWVSSGEALTPELSRRFHASMPHSTLLNLYGSSEVAADSTCYETRPGETHSRVSIGRPIANTQAYVLDPRLQPVPIGIPGDLYIGGAGLARGYLRPELTADRFIPNPFSGRPESRLYRTGDRVRYLPDGNIEFLGRIDHQVKVRGFRIELGEIERALTQHLGARETVVIACDMARGGEYGPGDKQLVAYMVANEGQQLTTSELRGFLQKKLPGHMVPSVFVMLESLPLTPNGKVDRRALPAPEGSQPKLKAVFVAPGTPVEEMLTGIWARILSIKQIGIHDNFFELGGHSLLATQVTSRVRDAFQVELPLRVLFESPTVADLAERIQVARRSEQGVSVPPLVRVTQRDSATLSFAQQRLWFLDQLEPGSPAYNIPAAVRLTGPLDVAALTQSLNQVIQRHEILRTTFVTREGRPTQVIAPILILPLPMVDLEECLQFGREAEARRLAVEEAQRPFDLTRGPLVRATLLRLGEQEHVMFLTMHHIASDGWSIRVLIREATALYRAFVGGTPSPLPELPIQYADYASWQRQWLSGKVLENQRDYWKRQLANAPAILELPTDRPRPAMQSLRGASRSFALSIPLSKALKALSQQEGVTLFMTLLAAFKMLLSRYTRQTDILVGSPIANRNRSEIEGLIGFFVNTLVLRTDLSGNPTFRELLGRVREAALGAYAHQDLPFEMLVDELQPERDLSHTPLFQVMFVLQNAQNAPTEAVELPGLTLSLLTIDNGMAQFDLTLSMIETEQGLAGTFEYNTDLLNAATITRLAGHFQTLLEGIVAKGGPERRISDLPLLTEAERQALAEWNNLKVTSLQGLASHTQTRYPQVQCIHELFETQVEQRPDAVAVVFPSPTAEQGEDQHLTYQELNRRANQVAHYLQFLGAGPEALVGLCVERSAEMITSLLGILKAGGAYLPLDPAYPKERLAFMLDDAHALIILTQEQLLTTLPQHKMIVSMDTDWATMARENPENPVSGVTADNLAYVIYTSGSTGKPKGVMVQHLSVVNYAQVSSALFTLQANDRMLQFATISFDAAAEEIFACWAQGATLVLRTDEMLSSTSFFMHKCRELGVTVLDFPTAYWHQVTLDLPAEGWTLPEQLRMVIIGGEKALAERLAAWQEHVGQRIRLVNGYGPTEATIATTLCEPLQIQAAGELQEVTIGRAICNAQMHILDPYLQPVPIRVPGEIYIGGIGLARGYLGQPEFTAERFIPNPFANEPGERLYKTGDLARLRPDGNIEFLGRIDSQVKVRGFRVELGEIETVLTQHPGVREAAVIAHDRTCDAKGAPAEKRLAQGDLKLVAYLVPKQEPVPSADELWSFVKSKLPAYMLPSAFVTLEAMPLTPSGKIDRRALPTPSVAKSISVAPVPLPRSANIADWFYVPSWKRTTPPERKPERAKSRWLLFGDGKGLSAVLARQLQAQDDEVITVREGKRFAGRGITYTLRPDHSEDYEALVARLNGQGQMPNQIVHLWNLSSLRRNALEHADEALRYSFYSLLFLAQAIGSQSRAGDLSLTVISSNMQRVVGHEVTHPEKAASLGLCRTIPQELPDLTCRSIDVALPVTGPQQETQLVERIIAEMEVGSQDPVVAYRGLDRWVRVYEPAPLPMAKEPTSPVLREGGVYLVTDGPDGMGLALAQYLARTVRARIVLITGTRLPEPEARQQYLATHDSQDPTSLLIRVIQELEALGLPGLTMLADVTSLAQMKAVVRAACQRFGAIHGVIHAASLTAGKKLLASPRSAAGVLGPAVQGTRVLEAVLQDIPLDFVLLCSPLTALVGGVGQGACCAANAFMGALAQAHAANPDTPTLSVSWDMEKVAGAAVNAPPSLAGQQIGEVLQRIISHRCLPEIIVSTRHLPTLIRQTSQLAHSQGGDSNSNLLPDDMGLRSETEEKLALIWQQLLGVQQVGRNDSFFRVGGHSLIAIQLISRVRDTFQVEIPVRTPFEAPTIAELAERIEQARAAARGTESPIVPVPRNGALTLSITQQWLLDHLQPDGPSSSAAGPLWPKLLTAPWRTWRKLTKSAPNDAWHNLVSSVRLTGALNVTALKNSLDEITRRHEMLRTIFPTVNGRPAPVVVPALALRLPVMDVRTLSEAERAARVQQWIADQACFPFNLAQGPLWQAILVTLSAEEHVLLLAMHPLVADERSVELFFQEMAALYKAVLTDQLPALPFLPIQYADYAAWQREWLQGQVLETQLAYWKQQWGEGLPVLELPVDRPRTTQSFRIARLSFTLSRELAVALETLSRQENCTLFMALLAAFDVLLYRQTQQDDIVLGAMVANRDRAEIENLIGVFGNTLALRANLGGDPPFRELLRQVRQVTSEAYAHRDVPFEMMVDKLRPGQAPDRPPVFQVMFTLQNDPKEAQALPGLTLSVPEIEERRMQTDLMLIMKSTPLSLGGALEYNANVFDTLTIARWARQFQVLLASIIANPGQRLAELSL